MPRSTSCRPWPTPVYFASAGYREFVWVSSPEARHSQNISVRPAGAEFNAVSGKVLDSMITGSLTKLYVASPAGDEPMVLCYPTSAGDARHAIGDDITLHWSRSDAVALPDFV